MGNDISPVFESAVVAVEVITIHMYLSGVFARNNRSRQISAVAFLVFGLLLDGACIFYPNMILLPLITFAGVFGLARLLYKGHILSEAFASLLYLMLAISIEAIVPTLHSRLFGVALASIRSFGAERVLSTITTKLLILLLVKVISIIMEKHRDSLERRMLQSIPLIICQLILISAIVYDFIHSYTEHNLLARWVTIEIIGLFFVDIVVLWYYELLTSIYELRRRNEIATMQLENQVKHYEIIKSHQETISAIEHDMKKHVRVIEGMTKDGYNNDVSEYLGNFSNTISESMGLVFTPHPTISSILSYCRQRAIKSSVELCLDISVPSDINISQIDLTVILGNTIDNALEALEEMTSGYRVLCITLKQSNYYLFYEITNTYDFSAIKKGATNKVVHGYGLNNVRACINKYKGSFHVKASTDKFSVTAMIPCKVKNPTI